MVILFEDDDLIIVNKPIGLGVQADKSEEKSLLDLVNEHLKTLNPKANAFLTHRVDKPTSGLVMFAKTEKATLAINALFAKRKIQKHYLAVVKNLPTPEKGTLINYLVHHHKPNKTFVSTTDNKEAKEAILEYEHIYSSTTYHLLKILLITGRHHQIRAQLSAIGSPIKGDLKYGFNRSNPDGGISLHSYSIAFEHPFTKENILVTAPLPDDNNWKYFQEGVK